MKAALPLIAAISLVLGSCTSRAPTPSPSPPAGTETPSATASPPATAAPPASGGPTRPASPAPPSSAFPASLRGQDLTKLPGAAKVVALTFDAGADANGVAPILKVLKDEGITATFFLTGDFVNRFAEPSRAIAAAGHRFANHSMTHPNLPQLSEAQARAQVRDAENAIRNVTGKDPKPFFRFPYGDRSTGTLKIVNDLGYVAVRWTVDSLGWQGNAQHTAASVAQRVLNAAVPGGIVMMHVGAHPDDHSTLDADALPAIISGLRQLGYSFVTLDVLLS